METLSLYKSPKNIVTLATDNYVYQVAEILARKICGDLSINYIW